MPVPSRGLEEFCKCLDAAQRHLRTAAFLLDRHGTRRSELRETVHLALLELDHAVEQVANVYLAMP